MHYLYYTADVDSGTGTPPLLNERLVWRIAIGNTTQPSTPERGNYAASQFGPDGELIDEVFLINLLRGQGNLLLPTEVLKALRGREMAAHQSPQETPVTPYVVEYDPYNVAWLCHPDTKERLCLHPGMRLTIQTIAPASDAEDPQP